MKKPKIWGHRGSSGYAPENTLEAFKLAVEMKSDGVELDVQMTRDGELVVIHDETIDRVSNGHGWVIDYTLKELKGFNYNRTHRDYEFVAIPTLEEVYSLLKDTELVINVELKTGVVLYEDIEQRILDLTRLMKMEERVIYSSFNHYSVMKIKELNPNALTGFLYTDGFINLPQYTKSKGVGALHPPFKALASYGFIEECKANELSINVWNIKDDDIKFCCENGINAIITNYPDRTRDKVNNFFEG